MGTVCFKTFGAGKLLGDTAGYNQPLRQRPRGKLSSGGSDAGEAVLPRLTVAKCLHYTLTLDPDVALLGLSYPNEQDAAFAAARAFAPLTHDQLEDIRGRAIEARRDKGPCWRAASLHHQAYLVIGGELLQDASSELQPPLDRLIGVGDAADVDGGASKRLCATLPQQLQGVLLDLHPLAPTRPPLLVAHEGGRVAVAAAEAAA